MREAGISAIVCPVDDAGKFTREVSDFRQYVKDKTRNIRNLKMRASYTIKAPSSIVTHFVIAQIRP